MTPTLIYLNNQKDIDKMLWEDINNPKTLEENIVPNSIFIHRCQEKMCVDIYDEDKIKKSILL